MRTNPGSVVRTVGPRRQCDVQSERLYRALRISIARAFADSLSNTAPNLIFCFLNLQVFKFFGTVYSLVKTGAHQSAPRIAECFGGVARRFIDEGGSGPGMRLKSGARAFLADVPATASTIKKEIEILFVSTGRHINAAFANLAQKSVDALLVGPSPLTNNRRAQPVTLGAYHKVPAIYSFRESAEAGGLMSYGANLTDADRQLGVYIGRVLKGQKPADLPVVQSAKLRFVINLFGLYIPSELFATADEVIE